MIFFFRSAFVLLVLVNILSCILGVIESRCILLHLNYLILILICIALFRVVECSVFKFSHFNIYHGILFIVFHFILLEVFLLCFSYCCILLLFFLYLYFYLYFLLIFDILVLFFAAISDGAEVVFHLEIRQPSDPQDRDGNQQRHGRYGRKLQGRVVGNVVNSLVFSFTCTQCVLPRSQKANFGYFKTPKVHAFMIKHRNNMIIRMCISFFLICSKV